MSKHLSKTNAHKNVWQLQEAKAKFSQLIEETKIYDHQTITKNGEPVAVIMSKKEFDKLTRSKTLLLDFFKAAPFQDFDLDLKRSQDLSRDLEL